MKKKKVAAQLKPRVKSRPAPYEPVPNKTWKIKRMSRELKEKLDSMLSAGEVKTSMQLKEWLGKNGFEISHRCIDDYRRKFERSLEAVRLATEQARLVCKQTSGDNDEMQGALMRLVQTRLFEVLVAANTRETRRNRIAAQQGSGDVAPTQRVTPVNITALARCVSGLARAETEHRKTIEHMRAGVAVAEKKLEEARVKGLSKNAADQIKAVLLEI